MSDEGKALLRQTVTKVLTSPSARKIDFTLGSIHVDYAGFMSVFMALASRQQGYAGIDIEIDEDLPAGAQAAYFPTEDKFHFPHAAFGLTDVSEKIAIIHESVHAMHDIAGGNYYSSGRGSRLTTRSENEAAAYVAGGLYLRYETNQKVAETDSFDLMTNKIVDSIQNRQGARVSDSDAMTLRHFIAAHPVYLRSGTGLYRTTNANGLKY